MANIDLHLQEAQHERNLLLLVTPTSLTSIYTRSRLFLHIMPTTAFYLLWHMLGATISLDENDMQ